jgi:hypothetical protein
MISDHQVYKQLTSLDEYIPSVGLLHGKTKAVIKLYSKHEYKLDGVPTTEIFINEDGTCNCREYGLNTLDCMYTITRAAKIIEALGLKLQ